MISAVKATSTRPHAYGTSTYLIQCYILEETYENLKSYEFNMGTNCVELLCMGDTMFAIDTDAVENAYVVGIVPTPIAGMTDHNISPVYADRVLTSDV